LNRISKQPQPEQEDSAEEDATVQRQQAIDHVMEVMDKVYDTSACLGAQGLHLFYGIELRLTLLR
jgi:hypothetical protein